MPGNAKLIRISTFSSRIRSALSFVAQIGLRLDFPLPRTDLAYSHCLGNAKSCKAIEDGGANLNLRNLPIEVPRGKSLTE